MPAVHVRNHPLGASLTTGRNARVWFGLVAGPIVAGCGADPGVPSDRNSSTDDGETDMSGGDHTEGTSSSTSGSGSMVTSDSVDSSGTGASGTTAPPRETCGDGVVEGDEACDDGNTADGDGCPATCMASPGMVYVAAGPFEMGCSPQDDGCSSEERPLHTVQVDSFEIDLTEVTAGAYSECLRDGACEDETCGFSSGGPTDLPIRCVTFEMAQTYCAWARKRLPTEAEWEKAARGAEPRVYPWGDDATSSKAAHGHGVEPVGAHAPDGDSPYGAHDMAGNVWEWVSDRFAYDYYEQPGPWDNPLGPDEGLGRVTRGGGYAAEFARWHRTSARTSASESSSDDSRGFRCARSP